MGDFIYFTEEQKERANAVPIMDILKREHEEVERSGNEWRWKRHGSVTFRGNRWYRHSQQMGSHAIDFMQEFFGMSYPEAVTYLLNGETGQVIHGGSPPRETAGKRAARPRGEETTEEKEPKILVPPEKNDTMKRVYAYLMQKRHISREVLSFLPDRESCMNQQGITTLYLSEWIKKGIHATYIKGNLLGWQELPHERRWF